AASVWRSAVKHLRLHRRGAFLSGALWPRRVTWSSAVWIAVPAGCGRLFLWLTEALLWLRWRRPTPFAPRLASPAPSVGPSAEPMADRRKARKSASKARSGATLPQQLTLTGNMPTRDCRPDYTR